MKLLALGFILTLAVSQLQAQEIPKQKTNFPYWTISKDVQKIRFKNEVFQKAAIKTGGMQTSFKGVSAVHTSRTTYGNSVRMNGTPAHVYSKGIWQLTNR